ncbi:sulfate transporter family protein [Pseudohyphozyma bogoriensis]|nr:sulfate transporter family protein [Pseudohyphozyma bogoriensis]
MTEGRTDSFGRPFNQLTDALVSNCGAPLHRETTHDGVKKRILKLIDGWVKDHKNNPDFDLMVETYDSLKSQNHKFEDDRPSSPGGPSDEILRREEEELQRALAESAALADPLKGFQKSQPNDYGSSSYNKSLPQQPGGRRPHSPLEGGFVPPASSSVVSGPGRGQSLYAQPQQEPEPQPQPQSFQGSKPSRVVALYDFDASGPEELAFRKDDVLNVVECVYDTWWMGELRGKRGIFPTVYVRVLPEPEPVRSPPVLDDAEMEAQLFAQAASIDKLLSMMRSLDPQSENLEQNEELLDLYQQSMALRPKVVKLIEKYNRKQEELRTINDKFTRASATYDRMVGESQLRHNTAPTPYQAPQGGYNGGYDQGYPSQGPPPSQQPQSAAQMASRPDPAALAQLTPQQRAEYEQQWAVYEQQMAQEALRKLKPLHRLKPLRLKVKAIQAISRDSLLRAQDINRVKMRLSNNRYYQQGPPPSGVPENGAVPPPTDGSQQYGAPPPASQPPQDPNQPVWDHQHGVWVYPNSAAPVPAPTTNGITHGSAAPATVGSPAPAPASQPPNGYPTTHPSQQPQPHQQYSDPLAASHPAPTQSPPPSTAQTYSSFAPGQHPSQQPSYVTSPPAHQGAYTASPPPSNQYGSPAPAPQQAPPTTSSYGGPAYQLSDQMAALSVNPATQAPPQDSQYDHGAASPGVHRAQSPPAASTSPHPAHAYPAQQLHPQGPYYQSFPPAGPQEGLQQQPHETAWTHAQAVPQYAAGSARLASLSLATPASFAPFLEPPAPSSSTLSVPLPGTSSSPRNDSTSVPTGSKSALSLARPSHLSLSPGSDRAHDGGSPESTDSATPTQSKMGSLATSHSLGKSAGTSEGGSLERTPRPSNVDLPSVGKITALGDETGGDSTDDEDVDDMFARSEGLESEVIVEEETEAPTETTALLGPRGGAKQAADGKQVAEPARSAFAAWGKVEGWVGKGLSRARKLSPEDVKEAGQTVVQALPAVILGTLMNILDGVSYGMIMFPTNLPVFSEFGGIGVSMFFVSCVISQLVYTGGGSIFKGGNGSMMIEVVPFYHVIAGIISSSISEGKSVVATTMLAFAISSVLTGLAFYGLGAMKLGSLSEFFPRHILVGCIGGVGAFLFITGLQVSARLEDELFSLELVKQFFSLKLFPLWFVPLALAIALRLITARYTHPLIFPGYFIAIPIIFYAIAFAAGFNVEQLREAGWVFEVNGVDSEWYEFWTLFDFKTTDFGALVETIPTQLALVFFGLLHVPINVPALAISVGEDNVNTDRELVAHGFSNVLAGLVGTVPNYLCYVNSVLFYKVGGTTRVSGFLLALASTGVLVMGPGVIGYLPVCVVGALIFILGIDLVKEAVWDTYGRVARFEFITIWTIIIVMTGWDFVVGIGVGIILACVSFVVTSSQRRAVRTILTGGVARSTVRRHPKQSAFLKEVGRQTRVIKLQGFLFFGTISSCETTIRKILEHAQWSANPIRFLVLDFSLASGVDFSAAEAFVRIQRLLEDKQVVLVLCGCQADSAVGKALRSVDLWVDEDDSSVKVFENLNDALEHCENAFLRSLYSRGFESPKIVPVNGPGLSSQIDVPKAELDSDVDVFENSPRQTHLRYAAKSTMIRADSPSKKSNFSQPLPLLLQSLRPFSPELDENFCFRLAPYFKRLHIERGTTLWTTGSESDSFYLIESGCLRASYLFLDRTHKIFQSMVAGTVSGEMSFLSRTKRNATVVAERDSVLWKLEISAHEEMGKKEGVAFCRKFEQCLMRIAIEEQEVCPLWSSPYVASTSFVGASVTLLGDSIFVFGGRIVDSRVMVSTLYSLDLSSSMPKWVLEWPRKEGLSPAYASSAPPLSEGPSPRYFHSCTSWGEDKLVIYGGQTFDGSQEKMGDSPLVTLDELIVWSVSTRSWSFPILSQGPDFGDSRLARFAHCAAIVDHPSMGPRLTVLGGQDPTGYVKSAVVLDLSSHTWVASTKINRQTGAYRSAAVVNHNNIHSSTIRPSSTDDEIAFTPEHTLPSGTGKHELLLYGNAAFEGNSRDLDTIQLHAEGPPTVIESSARKEGDGASLPPGIRFPNGDILGSYLLLSGLSLEGKPPTGRFVLWAMDLRSRRWRQLEVGRDVQSGSWSRSVVWKRKNQLVVIGRRDRDIVTDYTRRQLNFAHLAFIDLEAFGIYQPPSHLLDPLAQRLGLSILGQHALADFDLISADGDRLPASHSLLKERWPWFSAQLTTFVDKAKSLADAQQRQSLGVTPRQLDLPLSTRGCRALLQFIYTLSIVEEHAVETLCELLVFMKAEDLIANFRALVVHNLHSLLGQDPSKAVPIYEAATLGNCMSLQIRALQVLLQDISPLSIPPSPEPTPTETLFKNHVPRVLPPEFTLAFPPARQPAALSLDIGDDDTSYSSFSSPSTAATTVHPYTMDGPSTPITLDSAAKDILASTPPANGVRISFFDDSSPSPSSPPSALGSRRPSLASMATLSSEGSGSSNPFKKLTSGLRKKPSGGSSAASFAGSPLLPPLMLDSEVNESKGIFGRRGSNARNGESVKERVARMEGSMSSTTSPPAFRSSIIRPPARTSSAHILAPFMRRNNSDSNAATTTTNGHVRSASGETRELLGLALGLPGPVPPSPRESQKPAVPPIPEKSLNRLRRRSKSVPSSISVDVEALRRERLAKEKATPGYI